MFLYVIKCHHILKTFWRAEVYLYAFLTSAPDRNVWWASRPGRFVSREILPDTYWLGSWLCPRAGLDAVKRKNTRFPCRELNYDSSIVQPVTWSPYQQNYSGYA
jgi:hypothetical protein